VSEAVWPPVNSRAIVFTEIEAMGGAERSALALSRWLTERNLAHHFVMYVDHVGIAATVDRAIEVVQLRPAMRATKKVAALKKYFAARREGPKPLLSGFQPVLHASLAGIKGFHCLMHDTPSLFEDASSLSFKGRLNRWVSDKIAAHGLQSGGRTIVTSEYLREEVRRVYAVEADIARMGGFSETNTFRLRPVDDVLRMLSVSRIESNKRIDWMMRALAAMEHGASPLSSRVSWGLDIAGRGSQMDAMQKMASSLGLTERVRFLGYVSDTELEKLYEEAHLFLMPAVQGYGIPAVEAISRGLPVLLHRESGVSDILLETPWATVIDGGEENMLPGLQRAIEASLKGVSHTAALPVLPTEDAWAERVATLCGWV
jgi:glycosyltransferase involved in cell wall biosynthesis